MTREPRNHDGDYPRIAHAHAAVSGYAHQAARVERTVGWVLWTALVAVLVLRSF